VGKLATWLKKKEQIEEKMLVLERELKLLNRLIHNREVECHANSRTVEPNSAT
jgi:hypothetical protein